MNVHQDELELAQAYAGVRSFEDLNDQQLRAIRERGRELYKWFKAHLRIHNFINAVVIVSVLSADAFVLLSLPRPLLLGSHSQGVVWKVIAGVIAGSLHGWLIYSLSVLSLHEGAAHNLIFCGNGFAARVGQSIGRNLCRLLAGDPDYYAACHMAHHAKFGTEHDSEFLNFVRPRRLWMTFLPLAAFINYTDFVIHRPMHYTKSRAISAIMSLVYHGVYAYLAYRSFGLIYTITILILVTHFGFYLDRLRQFTEHNLMPLENQNGARSLGFGFWGMLVGGGPWGQPCHLAHHLSPAIPWYQQFLLHRRIKHLMTPRQRGQFLIVPFIGFPQLLWRIVHESNGFARTAEACAAKQGKE